MARLFLLRHAKAGWAPPGTHDFDRPLEPGGAADAEEMGQAMRAGGYVPDMTLCSTALRARQTLEGVAMHADTGRVVYLPALYSEDAAGYLSIIRENGGDGSLLVIGHNPMMEDLATAFSEEGDEEARAILHYGFPTSGLAIIGFGGSLKTAAPGEGHLEAFLTPARP
ncbi:histidine phosphatase family protein [Mesorhizobium sp. SP-1A]|uniref:SixA phosphatase family protein n=1 Tax=Mesorhizobium sp. SP-1A TaxID=3077840 RepID=UPI0028F6DC0C|nr:histidine phosphatase family protein [Mesorhizobium sp. SP-1A]